MKITGARVERFLRQPEPEIIAVLVFGPDQGLARERAQALVRLVVDDPGDPFRVVELTGAAVKSDPPRLIDEAAALSMTGGRRVIWVREATDGISEIFETLLKSGSDSFVIAQAGNIGPKSSLRKLFEKAGNAAAIGCYEDDGAALAAIIRETLARHGLVATAEASAYLADNLGGDRMISRNELEKLALYVGGTDAGGDKGKGGPPGSVALEDAMACIGDSAAMSLDAVAYATAGGDSQELDRALERAYMEGTSPVGVLRAVQRHLQRLHFALGLVKKGEAEDKAIQGLRPPVIFKFKARFRAQIGFWRNGRLADALELLTEAEIDCKSTGFPAAIGCHRALIRIAQAARSGARARIRAR